eukprot:scaffold2045_cov404-Prasinococcus_capsulatus_cf.AAC.30
MSFSMTLQAAVAHAPRRLLAGLPQAQGGQAPPRVTLSCAPVRLARRQVAGSRRRATLVTVCSAAADEGPSVVDGALEAEPIPIGADTVSMVDELIADADVEESDLESETDAEVAAVEEPVEAQPTLVDNLPGPVKTAVTVVASKYEPLPGPVKLGVKAGLVFLGGSLLVALVRYYQKYNSTRQKKLRGINKNVQLINELNSYLPSNRAGLTEGVVRKLRRNLAFTPIDIFRKYMRYSLAERVFDSILVQDLLCLRQVNSLGSPSVLAAYPRTRHTWTHRGTDGAHLSMTWGQQILELEDADVSDAIVESSNRIYRKLGPVMLKTEGLSAEGIRRKATVNLTFGKLLYLVETDGLLNSEVSQATTASISAVFGATSEDVDTLRLDSIDGMDIDSMEAQFANPTTKPDDQPEKSQ